MHRQRQPPRRRERFCAFIDQALGDQLVGHHAAQIVGRLRLHPRGNFLGEQFEQEIGHQAALPACGMHPGFAAGFCQFAHAHDVALPLGHRDHAAGVEQIEDVAGLDALVVGRQRHQMRLALAVLPAGVEIFLAGLFRHRELLEQHVGVGVLEIMPRIFLLGLQEHVAIAHPVGALAAVEIEVVDAVDALHIHREPLQPVGEFARHRRAFDARDLLEVGELRHFHAVAPALPAQPPGAQRRALPVVLDKADVVQRGIDADRGERFQIELLNVRRRRLQDHLELVIMLQPVGVFAVAAVLGPPRRLHIGRVPPLRAERAQRGGGMKGAGADFHVVGLQDHAALVGPEALQRQDQSLERAFRAHMRGQRIHRRFLIQGRPKARGTVSAGNRGIKAMSGPAELAPARTHLVRSMRNLRGLRRLAS